MAGCSEQAECLLAKVSAAAFSVTVVVLRRFFVQVQ